MKSDHHGDSSYHRFAGFWEKACSWLLPPDSSGGGFFDLLRSRWVEISFCTLFVFTSSWGQTFLLSLFQRHWRAEFDLSATQMGAIYSIATLISAYCFFAIMGIGFGASSGVITNAWVDLFGSDRIGLIKGLSSSVGVFSTAIAPVSFGFALESGLPLNILLIASATTMITISWPLSLIIGRTRKVI